MKFVSLPAAVRAFVFVVASLAATAPALAELVVTSISPALNATAPTTAPIVVTFNQAVNTATVNDSTFRVYGRASGPARGTFSFSAGDTVVTLTPDEPFSAGDTVFVNLSEALTGADTTTLRTQGYAHQFLAAVVASDANFRQVASFTNRSGGGNTRIYGASATDLDGDGFIDLATVNEDSHDVRVFLNRGDGSGLYENMLAPEPVGVEASPSEVGDFDNDGDMDIATSATSSAEVTILLNNGDGTFPPGQFIDVGPANHGIAALDVDGDADLDLVVANENGDNLSLMINDGAGIFGAPSDFEGGVDGEYGLTPADMNGDGITDLVVGGNGSQTVNVVFGNGDGTFTPGVPAGCGGAVWVVNLGDFDDDGDLDVASANDGSGTVGILMNSGLGALSLSSVLPIGSHTPSVDVGDLDGDGDQDLVVSSFGGGFWRIFSNDGAGTFTQLGDDIAAISNPSCSVILDTDNDGDLDISLFDEIADYVWIMENSPPSLCSSTPSPSCRETIRLGGAKLSMSNGGGDAQAFSWSWGSGEATSLGDFGDPLSADSYELCIYQDDVLIQGLRMPAGQNCPLKPCWTQTTTAWSYKDKELTPGGISKAKLGSGVTGKAKIQVKGKGQILDLPAIDDLEGVLDIQLQNTSGSVCWGATYSPPFALQDDDSLKAISDAP
ncbi:MAG TPA: FG-GAP-like repeat-containing protein [Candidatus Limnocylindrales bacterium]|nr:FG-GAP-like repeat-containing protein [Candidatus Limnocylindrales bacterium]